MYASYHAASKPAAAQSLIVPCHVYFSVYAITPSLQRLYWILYKYSITREYRGGLTPIPD